MPVLPLSRLHRIDNDLAKLGEQFTAAGARGDIDEARDLLTRIDELLSERSRVKHGTTVSTDADCG